MEPAMTFRISNPTERLSVTMTPMIDIVFQLIIFFMLSLKLFSAEGDFSIRMPAAAPQEGVPDENQTPPIKVWLLANKAGRLVKIQMGRRPLFSYKNLRQQVRDIASQDRGPAGTASNAEVELDCDDNLRFEYVIRALTAVCGEVAEGDNEIVRIVEKIKFAPPRKANADPEAS
jgi:biopolymer transport protein ExbD